MAFSADGRWLASAGNDNLVLLRHAATGQVARTLRGHTGAVWCVAFRSDGSQLATASLDQTVAAAYGVCVFEKLVQIAPVGESAKSRFFCQVCHARVLAEAFDNAPIYWPHCPYVDFKA